MLTLASVDRRIWVCGVVLLLCFFGAWNWTFIQELRSSTDLFGENTEYKYELCILTRVKDVSYLLPQWIEYHTNVGVDHIFIANDCSSDNGKTMFWARFYAKHRLVTLYESQDFNNCSQHIPNESALFDFLFHKAKHACEWVTVIDADEYMVPSNAQQSVTLPEYESFDVVKATFGNETETASTTITKPTLAIHTHFTTIAPRLPLKQLIYALNKLSQPIVRMPWYLMSTHGLETRPSGLILNAYTHGQYAHIRKTLVRSQYVSHWIDSHAPQRYVWNLPKVKGHTFKDYARSFVVRDDEFSTQMIEISGKGAMCEDYRRYLRGTDININYSVHAHNTTAQLHSHNGTSSFAQDYLRNASIEIIPHINKNVSVPTLKSTVIHCTRAIACTLPKSPLSIYHFQGLSWQDYQSIRASRKFDSTGIPNGWSVNARNLWLGFNYTYIVCSEGHKPYLKWAARLIERSAKAKFLQYATESSHVRNNKGSSIDGVISNGVERSNIDQQLANYYLKFVNGDILD